MRHLSAAIAILTLFSAPSRAQKWLAAQAGISHSPVGVLLDIPDFHLTWKTPISLALDGAVGICWGNGVYDSADADLSYEVLRNHTTTFAPRVGLSSMIHNDRTAQNGINAGIALRHHRSHDTFRVDVIYRRLGGHAWVTLVAGSEWKL